MSYCSTLGVSTTAEEPLAPGGRLSEGPEPSLRFLAQRGLPAFAIEGFAPILLFYAVWKLSGLAPAAIAATALSAAIVGWQARRGLNAGLAVVTLIFVLIQTAVALVAHSATLYLAQPLVLSACWG